MHRLVFFLVLVLASGCDERAEPLPIFGSGGGGGSVPGSQDASVPGPDEPGRDTLTEMRFDDPSACTTGERVLVMIGDDDEPIHEGFVRVEAGAWTVASTPDVDQRLQVQMRVVPEEPSQGTEWTVVLSTEALDEPLDVATFEGAVLVGQEEDGEPGLSVAGNGRSCASVEGRFKVHELSRSGESDLALTATFVQRCDGSEAQLVGCIHVEGLAGPPGPPPNPPPFSTDGGLDAGAPLGDGGLPLGDAGP